jgi:hypothetical protein
MKDMKSETTRIDLKELESVIAARAKKQGDINSEEASLAQASQELTEIGKRGNYASDLKRLGEAGARAQIIPLRLKILYRELVDIEEAIIAQLRRCSTAWNIFVAARVEDEFTRFVQAALPSFGGPENEKAVRLKFESLHIPAVASARRAFVELGDFRQIPLEAGPAVALNFIKVCESWWKRFGRELPVVIELVSRPAPEKCPKTITVRAREDFTAECLAEHTKSAEQKRQPGLIREGKVMEVSVRTFRSLSRFLEPAEPLPDVVFKTRQCDLPE